MTELGYQLLPLATSQLVGDNREFKVKAYFKVFCTIRVKDSLRDFEDLSFY